MAVVVLSVCAWSVDAVRFAYAQTPQTFSNVFFQSEINEALQQVALQTGVNIVATDNVTGLVSMSIEGKTAAESVEMILSGTRYDFEEFEDYIFVYDPSRDTAVTLGVSDGEIFIPQNVSAFTIFELLPEEFRSFVTVTPDAELLYIRAGRDVSREILALVAQLDSVSRKSSRRIALNNVSSETVEALIPGALSRYVTFSSAEEVIFVYGPEARVEEITRLVADIDTEEPEPQKRQGFRIGEVSLENISSAQYLQLLPAQMRDFASAAEETDKVIVYAPPEIISDLKAIARIVDEPAEQIQLTARVVALKQSSLMQLGNQIEYPELSAGAAFSDLPDSDLWEFRVGYSASRSFTNALNLRLSLLAENNDATIVASPEVTTQSGSPAEIRVTTAEYFQLAIERDGFFSADLEQIETGTILTVTPSVARNGAIELDIDIEVSDVVSRNENDLPVVVSRRASTLVEVDDGGTATIAGLVDTRTSSANSGVPGMRRLPLLGRGFSQDNFNHEVAQVAIFVTAELRGNGVRSRLKIPAADFRSLDDAAFRDELKMLLGAGN
jgi:type II secretory pathway component GspD/PulD (secretin)